MLYEVITSANVFDELGSLMVYVRPEVLVSAFSRNQGFKFFSSL